MHFATSSRRGNRREPSHVSPIAPLCPRTSLRGDPDGPRFFFFSPSLFSHSQPWSAPLKLVRQWQAQATGGTRSKPSKSAVVDFQ